MDQMDSESTPKVTKRHFMTVKSSSSETTSSSEAASSDTSSQSSSSSFINSFWADCISSLSSNSRSNDSAFKKHKNFPKKDSAKEESSFGSIIAKFSKVMSY